MDRRSPSLLVFTSLSIFLSASVVGADVSSLAPPPGADACFVMDLEAALQAPASRRWWNAHRETDSWIARQRTWEKALPFLESSQLNSVTGYTFGDDVVLSIRGKIDWDRVLDVAGREPKYVVVRHDNFEIHHWVSDMSVWSPRLLGAQSHEANREQPLFMTRRRGSLLVASALRPLLDTLESSGGTRVEFDGDSQGTLILGYQNLGDKTQETRLKRLVVRASEMAHVQVELQAPDEASANSLEQMFQPASLKMFLGAMAANHAGSQQDKRDGEELHEQKSEEPHGSEDAPKRRNELRLSVGINGEGVKDFDRAMKLVRQALEVRRVGPVVKLELNSFATAAYHEKVSPSHAEIEFRFMLHDAKDWKQRRLASGEAGLQR